MLNTVYRLISPKRIEANFTDITLTADNVLVRPTYLSICHADQRYYQGRREGDILREKLPMALIHEAVGRVMYDPVGKLKAGEGVILIPNQPFEKDAVIEENYLESSKFRASSCDGFMQEYVITNRDRLLRVPKDLTAEMGAFTEMVSVCTHTVMRFERFSHDRRKKIGIWGDGNLSYILSAILSELYKDCQLYVMGVHEEKLATFTFADQTFHVDHIPDDLRIDHAFECVGGSASQSVIEQIIARIHPEGSVALMGVSENAIPVNTRMVLEKGLHVFGSSRSGKKDFEKVIELYKTYPRLKNYFLNLIGCVMDVKNIQDMSNAFEYDLNSSFGKTIMRWDV
ncbi:MAG: alcohol dehydrogenase catalytic domain-containing protein [Lachnospiraceae bacterium]|nr:alcohol dehydrogenase catalytic domain-containing protein [Lachnospiraceae bacterium]